MKKRFFLSFVFVLMSLSLFAETKSVVDISVKTENISDSEAAWLAPAVAEKLESNLSKYTDFTFVNSADRKDILNIQKQSEGSAFDEEDAIEIGKFKNADYQLFATIRKAGAVYTLSVKLTDITTTINKVPAIVSKPRSAVQNLYSSTGSAVDEITIDFCKALGKPLSNTEKTYLMNGEIGLSDKEKQSIYDADEKLYKEQIAALDKQIRAKSVSADINAGIEEEKLKAARALAEEKLKIAQENQKRVEEEAARKKEQANLDASRTEEQKNRIKSMASELNKKVQSVRNSDYEGKSLLGQINVIELKKKAVLEIYNNFYKNIENEKSYIRTKADKDINAKKSEIYNKPYRAAELDRNGKPVKIAKEKRDKAFAKAKNEIINNRDNSIKQLEVSLNNQIYSLITEIEQDGDSLKTRKISTLGNELIIKYSQYDGANFGWDVYVTVKSDDVILLQTKSFLSFNTITGKDTEKYIEANYDEYLDDVDFYNSLFLRGEPIFTYDLEYSVEPLDINSPSQYKFNFYNFTCYDTNTLEKYGENLSSAKTYKLSLENTNVVRQMWPVYDMKPLDSYVEKIEKIRLAERTRLAEEKRLAEVNRIKEEKILLYKKAIESDNVILLDNGTDGSYRKRGSYALFGVWPQSIKDDSVIIDISKTKKINGWECYSGSDGFYYVMVKADPYDDNHVFSNGEKIEENEVYFFLLEPIKWRIIDNNYQNGKLLLAENVLDSLPFYKDNEERGSVFNKIYPNNYEKSIIRAYLNGLSGDEYQPRTFKNKGFIDKAFSPQAIAKINTVTVDNSAASTGYKGSALKEVKKYVSKNTKDKIFLLSGKEVIRSSYGFDSTANNNDPARRRNTTDYSRAVGTYSDIDSVYKNNGQWWLRSPNYYHGTYLRTVGDSGYVCDGYNAYSYVDSAYGGIVPALTISQELVAPDVISDFNVILNGHEVTLSYSNPTDSDFEKVIITGLYDKDIEIKGKPEESVKKTFSNLKPNTKFNINIKTVDIYGNMNDTFEFDFITDYEPEVNLYEVPEKTNIEGTIGTKGNYVLFGLWPQTVKESNVIIDISKTKKINNWDCILGSDGFYYVKAEAHPLGSDYEFENGDRIKDSEEYYFKLEPIKWRVVTDNYQGGKLLVAENVIINSVFDTHYNHKEDELIGRSIDGEKVYPNNYKYSTVRAYLNGLNGIVYGVENFTGKGFINNAFTKKAIENINTVTVDNSVKSTVCSSNKYACENTKDKIFLLSQEEVTKSSYGFDSDAAEHDMARIRKPTDYSRAIGAYSATYFEEYKNNGFWWLRSAVGRSGSAGAIVSGGDTGGDHNWVGYTYFGVVPALSISF